MWNTRRRGRKCVSHAEGVSVARPAEQGDRRAQEGKEYPFPRPKRPPVQDQLVVLLMSLGLAVFVLALGYHAGWMVELVLVIIVTFATLTINLLFAFSREDP